MVKIRMARGGSKKRPFYSIVVADQRRATGSRFIERIGYYNPMAVENEEKLRLDVARAEYWIGNGAQPTSRVSDLLKQASKEAVAA